MKTLIKNIINDYPDILFAPSDTFYWSPKDHAVYYDQSRVDDAGRWALIHELSHAVLGHKTYKTDFELLQLEVGAWHKAEEIAKKYDIKIDQNHVQDCLDTYRDWLHARSKCPACGEHGIQSPKKGYKCINCLAQWHVSEERFCRAYRRLKKAT